MAHMKELWINWILYMYPMFKLSLFTDYKLLIEFYNEKYLTSVTSGTRHWKSTSSFPNWSFPVWTTSFEPSTTFSSMRRSSLALVLSEIEKTISSPSTTTVFYRFPQFEIFKKQQKIWPKTVRYFQSFLTFKKLL